MAAHVQELIGGFWPMHVVTVWARLELPEAPPSGPAGIDVRDFGLYPR